MSSWNTANLQKEFAVFELRQGNTQTKTLSQYKF